MAWAQATEMWDHFSLAVSTHHINPDKKDLLQGPSTIIDVVWQNSERELFLSKFSGTPFCSLEHHSITLISSYKFFKTCFC